MIEKRNGNINYHWSESKLRTSQLYDSKKMLAKTDEELLEEGSRLLWFTFEIHEYFVFQSRILYTGRALIVATMPMMWERATIMLNREPESRDKNIHDNF